MDTRETGLGFTGFVLVFLIVCWVLIKLWWLILIGGLICAFVYLVERNEKAVGKRTALEAEVAARADRQHNEMLNGDVHGLYGDYMPPEGLR
jgi:hypothetical protein